MPGAAFIQMRKWLVALVSSGYINGAKPPKSGWLFHGRSRRYGGPRTLKQFTTTGSGSSRMPKRSYTGLDGLYQSSPRPRHALGPRPWLTNQPAFHTPGLADGFALPATGIDPATRRQLDAAVRHGVMHDPGLAGDDVGAAVGRRSRGNGRSCPRFPTTAGSGSLARPNVANPVKICSAPGSTPGPRRGGAQVQVAQHRLQGLGRRKRTWVITAGKPAHAARRLLPSCASEGAWRKTESR